MFDFWQSAGVVPEHAFKLFIAFVCGFLIGWERERAEKPAGLRTIVLISVGSALFMIVSEVVSQVPVVAPANLAPDPGRIAAQVVSGIGFLGAGTIIQTRGSVHGLTTAATIWVAAAIGLCAGAGLYATALASAAGVVVVLLALHNVETNVAWPKGKTRRLIIRLPNDSLVLDQVRLLLEDYRGSVAEVKTSEVADHLEMELVHPTFSGIQRRLLHELAHIRGVSGVPMREDEE